MGLSSKFELREAEMKASISSELKETLKTEVAAAVKKSRQDVPDLIQCAYQYYLDESDAQKFVTFDRLISDYNNNNPGSFDLKTGRFEAAVAGYYSVTFSATAVLFMEEG